ncbi:MAG TPA: flagellar hook protein FlgE [Rhizomicrobium sp.]
MSLYGALMTGVAGLTANSQALSVASSNIANVNTVGYKTGEADFSTLLASAMGSGDVSSAGVVSTTTQNVTQQGLLNSTGIATDLAISGNGFFVVSQQPGTAGASQSQLYTRAGDFTPDANGDLQNSAGLYLQGWPLDGSGNVPTDRNDLTAINVNNLSGKAEATTTMSVQANLQSSTTATSPYNPGDMTSGAVTPDFQRTINVYDSQGGTQPLQVSYLKTGANQWSYEVSYQGDASNLSSTNTPPNLIASGTMTFNNDGSLANVQPTGSTSTTATGSVDVGIPWDSTTSGLAPQTISLNMGTVGGTDGVTQFDSASALVSSSVNGALFGSVSGVSIDSNGFVTANFTNGLSQKIYKLPIATFTNPDGLAAVSGNAYQVSQDSGTPTIGEANTGGAGTLQSGALEGSTVDLATEFTNLITTQRAYEASTRIITTASDMLDQLLQMGH